MRIGIALAALSLLPLTLSSAAASPLDVTTQHNDNARTGANLNESILTTQNVNDARFGKLFTRAVTGSLYAQPLYLSGVSLQSATHNVVYLATMHNVVYCFDADDPAASSPLWSVTLEAPATLPDGNIGVACGVYHDIADEIGIISTPVIDAARQLMFVVTFSRSGSGDSAVYSHHLHALSLIDGSEQLGGPVQLAASVPGTGDGASGGNVAFQSEYENQRMALLLSNGEIYIGFAGYCDSGPYHGWLLAYDASSLQLSAAYNNTADGSEGGIWQSGEGASADSDGKIYISVGNGSFNYSTGGLSLGEGFTRLSAGLSVEDYFVPYNYVTLNAGDRDLGSTGLLLIPGSTLLLGGSKAGELYLTDRTNLGHFNVADDSQIAQSINLTNGPGIYGSPVYWNGPNGPTVYVWGQNDHLKAFQFDGSNLVSPPASVNLSAPVPKMPGGILSVSADGATAGSGLLWSNMTIDSSANQATVPGVLRAFDASDVTVQLWTSQDNAARDSLGNFGKFTSPTVTNGKVYLSTFSNQLVVYGLLPAGATLQASPSPAPLGQPVTLTAVVLGPERGMPTGQVTFFDDTTALGAGTLDAEGEARWSGPLGVGAHPLTAFYPGDGNFTTVTSPIVIEQVQKAPSVTALTSGDNPLSYPGPATLSARVTALVTPTGSVSFSDGATPLGSSSLDGSGLATLVVSSRTPGTHALTAVYGGDAQVSGSSGGLSEVVNRAASTLTLSATPSAAPLGGMVRFDFVLSSVSAATGTVILLDGSTSLGEATLDGGGQAELTVTLAAAGSHTLTADYGGDGEVAPASATLVLVVERGDSSVALAAASVGAQWLLTASVSGGDSGTVIFRDGSSSLGSVALGSSGSASLNVPLAPGWHALSADYGGDDDYDGSQSAPLLVAVPGALVDGGAADAALVADAALADANSTSHVLAPACAIAGQGGGNGLALAPLLVVMLWLVRRRIRPQ